MDALVLAGILLLLACWGGLLAAWVGIVNDRSDEQARQDARAALALVPVYVPQVIVVVEIVPEGSYTE